MESSKVVALIGTIVFMVAGFLPLITVTQDVLGTSSSYSATLFDLYRALGQSGESSAGSITLPPTAYAILLTVILYPIAVILGFVAIAKRKIALAAGALGLLAWIGTLVFLSTLNAVQYTGFGVYVGIVGAIIMAVAYFIKPGPAMQQTIAPPPPPVQQ